MTLCPKFMIRRDLASIDLNPSGGTPNFGTTETYRNPLFSASPGCERLHPPDKTPGALASLQTQRYLESITQAGRLTQWLECHPHTVEVAGSNPAPPILKPFQDNGLWRVVWGYKSKGINRGYKSARWDERGRFWEVSASGPLWRGGQSMADRSLDGS
jgi:hypothetical protein